jgi:hypothetical protein
MCENRADQRGILDAGDNAERAAAIRTGLDVDLEHSFQAAALVSLTNSGGMQ